MRSKWAMRGCGRVMAMVVALGGIAGGCYGGVDEASAVAVVERPLALRVRLVAGELQADGSRHYTRFVEQGGACVVSAPTEALAFVAKCPWERDWRADPQSTRWSGDDLREAVLDSVATVIIPVGMGGGRAPGPGPGPGK